MYLVTGGTGNAGGAVARALLAAGQPVRILVRPGREAAVPGGAEPVPGDLNRPETVAAALTGVRGVFLLSGYQRLGDLLASASQAGVARVVLLSSSAAPSGDLSNAIARYHIESERLVEAAGVGWTFLRPNTFMTNTFRWLSQVRDVDVVRLPFADVPIAAIDPEDIGAVAALALTSGDHEGRTYRLSGPQALRPAEQVAVVAQVLGRDLTFEAQPHDEARREMSAGMPAEYVDAIFSFFADGTIDESTVLPTVENLLGRPPRSYLQWAHARVEALREQSQRSPR